MDMERLGRMAKDAKVFLNGLTEQEKNTLLRKMARSLRENSKAILEGNRKDLADATAQTRLDRLRLDDGRIEGMACGLEELADIKDPVGEVMERIQRPNGLLIEKVRVPIGVIGIIYEARPNVTSDAAGICFKTGNAVILKGGREALHSNKAITRILHDVLEAEGFPDGCIQLVEDPSRETTLEMMRLDRYIDLLIPRGGALLIRSVVENATIPVIETGVGNCHVYIDSPSDLEMGVRVIVNAKTSRPSVCNAAETLLVHRDMAKDFLPVACEALKASGVEIRGCQKTRDVVPWVLPAGESDWEEEFLDNILAVRTVENLEEAVLHIRNYGTMHSEAIVTSSPSHGEAFARQVDAAVVYINASTRFTDGGEFGYGAEIGISTQKLHARGPMGLKEMTSYKYIVKGNGQVR
ncbi:MAG: glutamate-5-semialdehyde dehydrogenase [Clostridia bacterium]